MRRPLRFASKVEEELDWFRERARKEHGERDARAEGLRHAVDQAQRERHRAEWLADWQQRAMRLIPADAPGDTPRTIHAAVADALAKMRMDESVRVVEPMVP